MNIKGKACVILGKCDYESLTNPFKKYLSSPFYFADIHTHIHVEGGERENREREEIHISNLTG